MTKTPLMLLCYDGSPEAAHAIDVAAALLAPRRVVVVDVAPLLTPAERVATTESVVPGAAGFSDLNRENALARAEEGAERAQRAGLQARGLGIVSARTWEGILRAAYDVEATVIVVGSRHLRGLQELTEESVSHRVMAETRRPVFIVPQADQVAVPDGLVLLCDDGTAGGRATVELAATLLRSRRAVAVDAQHVPASVAYSAEPSNGPWLDEQDAASARRRADALAATASQLGFQTETFETAAPRRWLAVAEAADDLDAAVVVCADPRTAYEVSVHTLRPVLLVRSPRQSAETQRRSLLDRARRFWGPSPAPDHPLSDGEREPEPARIDRAARQWEGVFGDRLRRDD
jgi:nucleotide-binding universal stress UspA family protein